ncbi:MAG: UDP-N-acetylmuramate dehydrogenase [bacterium]|nr:MAG: UDP-N-acetylmuramate dehydrogenase [bacterium]
MDMDSLMDRAKPVTDICQQLEVAVRCGQKMKNHTALGVGGEIDAIAYPETPEAAAMLVAELDKANIPWSALGRGSRILAKDQAINRIAISLKLLEEVLLFKDIENREDKLVQVHGGYQLSKLAIATVERGFWRLENFASHLGTVGSAIYRKEQQGLFMSALKGFTYVCDGKIKKIENYELFEKMDLKYPCLILGASLDVLKIKSAYGQEKHSSTVKRLLKKRREDLLGTGPVFEEKAKSLSTRKLIADAGLKGFSCGSAMIATHNANFIVNKGNAATTEVLELIEQVKDKVKKHSGIELKLALEIWE